MAEVIRLDRYRHICGNCRWQGQGSAHDMRLYGGADFYGVLERGNPITPPFSEWVYDHSGNRIEFDRERADRIEVSLSDTQIYVCPWDYSRTARMFQSLPHKEFQYDQHNHKSVYYTDIDLCFVDNGNHSINAGRYLKKGRILSPVYHLECLYPHILTDGRKWYDRRTGSKAGDVEDFRFAALYTLAQRRAGLTEPEAG